MAQTNQVDDLVPKEEEEEIVVPQSNEWGIEIVSEQDKEEEKPETLQPLAEGIEYAYMRSDEIKPQVKQDEVVNVESKNLADLMSELDAELN